MSRLTAPISRGELPQADLGVCRGSLVPSSLFFSIRCLYSRFCSLFSVKQIVSLQLASVETPPAPPNPFLNFLDLPLVVFQNQVITGNETSRSATEMQHGPMKKGDLNFSLRSVHLGQSRKQPIIRITVKFVIFSVRPPFPYSPWRGGRFNACLRYISLYHTLLFIINIFVYIGDLKAISCQCRFVKTQIRQIESDKIRRFGVVMILEYKL